MSHCRITYDAAAGCVVMAWDAYGGSAAFRADNERVLATLVANRAMRLLGEIESLGELGEADKRWLTDVWIPRAVAAGLRRAALVTPAFDLGHAPVLLVGEEVRALLELAYFETTQEALAWLKAPALV